MIFTIASALCALAGTPLVLNLARALQGMHGLNHILVYAAILATLLARPQDVIAHGSAPAA